MSGVIISKHFSLEKISEGVFAAIAKDGSGSVGNAGFIDLGGQTIIFDTFNTPQAAEDLKRAAERVTGTQPILVVNSHHHGDHIRGNQIFKKSMIISSQITYETMQETHPARIEKQKQGIKELGTYIASLKNQLGEKTDKELEHKISFLGEIEISLPILQLTLPNQTFKDEMTFYGTKRSAKLFTLGGGHSICDAMLYVPEEKILFMGDLLFTGTHPTFFEESNPRHWVKMLKTAERMDLEKAVPGHGPVGTKVDITRMIDYIEEMIEVATTSNGSAEHQVPAKYKHWSSLGTYQQNLRMLGNLLTASC